MRFNGKGGGIPGGGAEMRQLRERCFGHWRGESERTKGGKKMKKFLAKMRNEEGQALVEYGLLVALIAVVCIAVITLLGTGVRGAFQSIVDAL